jgi:hypothetical protein
MVLELIYLERYLDLLYSENWLLEIALAGHQIFYPYFFKGSNMLVDARQTHIGVHSFRK